MRKFYALLFLGGFATMTVELVAGRLIAPFLGSSLYTWTGIIGACLAGMTLGNLYGGHLADTSGNHRRTFGLLFALTSLFTGVLAIPLVPAAFSFLAEASGLHPVFAIFVTSLVLFGVPCFFAGAISPVVYRVALAEAQKVGATVGRLSASGVLGSITGTYLTGFWLIPTFGTRAILLGIAAVLALIAALAMPWRSLLRREVVAALVLMALPWGVVSAAPANPICQWESEYYCLRIVETKTSKGTLRALNLDRLIHSGYLTEDPHTPWYVYERIAGWLFAAGNPAGQTLHVGGGGYLYPAWLERNFPEAGVDVIEIDPMVTEIALNKFLPEKPQRIRTYNEDARTLLRHLPSEQRYDVIYGDAYGDISAPYHLTTREYYQLVRERLTAEGIYVANILDTQNGKFLTATASTLQATFGHVYILTDLPDHIPGPRILVASTRPLPWDRWDQHLTRPAGVTMTTYIASPGDVVLTDEYVPVDTLTLPMVTQRWGEKMGRLKSTGD